MAPRKKRSDEPKAKLGTEEIATNGIVGSVIDTEIQVFAEEALREYGSHVVENRAIPDFRDGLKPVHRAILWAMYDLNLGHSKPYKKAARTIGDVIGRWHPHGDQSAYGAMVTLANTKIPLVDGFGNFGDFIEGAAAMRYTEGRLSKFSDLILLDPQYLAVVPKVKNFSGDAESPRFLPAKLPVQLLIGSPTVPAYGVRAGNPSFGFDGVVKLVKLGIKGREITPELCLRYLKIDLRWGGNCVASDAELLDFYTTGAGNLPFEPDYELDYAKKEFRILSTCPGRFATAKTISSAVKKIGELKGVAQVGDRSAAGVGKYNICYAVKFGRVSEIEMNELAKKIVDLVSGRGPFELGWTYRKAEETTFAHGGVAEFFNRWIKYRVSLECAVIKHLIKEEHKKLERQKLLEWAVLNRELIFEAVRRKDKKTHPVQYLMKHGKVEEEFAAEVLRLPVLSLSGLDLDKIRERQREIRAEIKLLETDLKDPKNRLITQLDTMKL
jgi:DNA gyrase/topoisomerase IV subunit A